MIAEQIGWYEVLLPVLGFIIIIIIIIMIIIIIIIIIIINEQ